MNLKQDELLNQNLKNEMIGKVELDYTDYPGEDLYCDGKVEEELLEIARNCSSEEFQGIIEDRKEWPVLYHLSKQRENIVSWLPITKKDRVLEIGSGCGAITGALADMAGEVTCIDLSRQRSLINAYRHENCDNIKIKVGNFKDIEPKLEEDFDYALLIGVFEYGQLYIGGGTPFEDFLKIIRKHVSKKGKIVIAIENKFGLKYFAGCREDHLGTFFSGVEGYPDGGSVRTFSRPGLERIFKNCGEEKYTFYYPYPDYKFMTTLFSDSYLPKTGELTNNMRNFDRDRMLLFDEKKVFDGLSEDGLFSQFSNSFLVVLGERPKTEYIRYSNDRVKAYQISTEITESDKTRIIEKHALSNEGIPHIEKMKENAVLLTKKFAGSGIGINQIADIPDKRGTAAFEFEKGRTLTEILDDCLRRENTEELSGWIEEYADRLSKASAVGISDYDLAFSNILIDEEKNWKLIDYEWCFNKEIPVKELIFRAIYCYLLEDEKRNKLNFDFIFNKLSITEDEAQEYRENERKFQEHVTGKHLSMPQIREAIGQSVFEPLKYVTGSNEETGRKRVQIYLDLGDGFSEENAWFLEELYDLSGNISFSLSLPSQTRVLRIDPCMQPCILTISACSLNGKDLLSQQDMKVTANGKVLKDSENGNLTIVYDTEDPGFSINLEKLITSTGNTMLVTMQMSRLPMQAAAVLQKELRKKIRL